MNTQPDPRTERTNAFERILGGVIGAIGEQPAETIDLVYLEYIARWVLDTYETPRETNRTTAERALALLENDGVTAKEFPTEHLQQAAWHLSRHVDNERAREEAAKRDAPVAAWWNSTQFGHDSRTTWRDLGSKDRDYARGLFQRNNDYFTNNDTPAQAGEFSTAVMTIRASEEPDRNTVWSTSDGFMLQKINDSWCLRRPGGGIVRHYVWRSIPSRHFPLEIKAGRWESEEYIAPPNAEDTFRPSPREITGKHLITDQDRRRDWRDALGNIWYFNENELVWEFRDPAHSEGTRSTPTNFPWTRVVS